MSIVSEIASGAAGGLLGGIKSILNTFVADKSQEATDKASYALQDLIGSQAEAIAQIKVDEAEAESPDRINHWRGGLGWVCVAAIAGHYLIAPVCRAFGFMIPVMDQSALLQLVLLMLGSHAVPVIADAVKSMNK